MDTSENPPAEVETEMTPSHRRKMFHPKKSERTKSQSEEEEEEDEEDLLAAAANINEGSGDEEDDIVLEDVKEQGTEGVAAPIQGDTGKNRMRRDEWRLHWGIKCHLCSEMYPSRPVFEQHYFDAHRNDGYTYQCSYCNKCMDHYSTFRSHRYRHITEGRFRCEQCKKGFSVRSLLRVHILSKHADVKPYMCETCGRGFGTRPGLNLHLEKHRSTAAGRQWPCELCGKVLLTSSGHKAHLAVHQQGKRFMCELCGKTFTQKVNMQQHLKGHSGEKPFICDICGKAFAEKSHLNRHHSFHSDARPFRCNVCLKMYKTERCLKVHSMTHARERPCVCSYCGKGFLSNNKLKQHYNIHTGERPYSCKFCERTFTNYPNYLKHTRRRHKLELAQLGATPASLAALPSNNHVMQQSSSSSSQPPSLLLHPIQQQAQSLSPMSGRGDMCSSVYLPSPHLQSDIKYEPHDSLEMCSLPTPQQQHQERDPLDLGLGHMDNNFHQYQTGLSTGFY